MSAYARKYHWLRGNDREPGYKIQGSKGGYAWVSAEDAYDLCSELADLIDTENGLSND